MSFLLGGRVRHDQPARGHRTGIEPVLLAASIPVRVGERVLEGGSGAGAALLCVAARVADVTGVGVEIDPALVALAAANAAANGFERLDFVAGDVADRHEPDWSGASGFDHAMANPPWHAASATSSPEAHKALARQATPGLLVAWARALARGLRHRGTLTWVIGADHTDAALAALAAAGCGGLTLFPLWPRAGVGARLVLVRGVKGGRGPFRLLPGLVLHEVNGAFTPAAEAVLRLGEALEF